MGFAYSEDLSGFGTKKVENPSGPATKWVQIHQSLYGDPAGLADCPLGEGGRQAKHPRTQNVLTLFLTQQSSDCMIT
jgi:hypothetical protein